MFLLRCRTSHSDPEAPTVAEAAEAAVDAGLSALAVTELDSLDSVAEAREALDSVDLLPITGLEWTGIGGGERLLLYARNRAGFRDLISLLARSPDSPPEPPRFGLESIDEDGLFILCNAPGSLMRTLIRTGREREALTMLHRYLEWFGRRAIRVVLPPDLNGEGALDQRRALGIMARDGVRFVSLGCDEVTGRPLSDDELSDGYLRCQAAVQESRDLIEGCEFRWTPPEGGLARVAPGRGYRSESFVWDRCHQELVRRYGPRRKDEEKRLYREFQEFRDAEMFDLLVGLSQIQGRTSLGCPLVWPVNPWATTTLVGHLLGISSTDPASLGVQPGIPKQEERHARGIDVTLLLGRGEWKRCLEAVEGVFGKEHVVFRRGKPVGRPPAEVDPDLFSAEGSSEERPTPVTEIVVSRFRWLDFLPASETEPGHLETTLPPELLARLPFYRFHLRRDKLITILTLAARDVSHQGHGLDLFAEPGEVHRFLTGSDGGRGIMRLGVHGLSGVENYLRLRTHARRKNRARKQPDTLDGAVRSIAEAFIDEDGEGGDRDQRLVFARKLFAVASMCLNYPRSYYTALFSSVELELDDLRKLMSEAMLRGVPVTGPDINKSAADTVVTSDGIRLGLRCIRGIGPVISNSLIGSRERKPFNSLQDLCRRTDRRRVNRRVLTRLIEFGALDDLEGDREAQKAALAWMLGENEGGGLRPRQLFLFAPPAGGPGDTVETEAPPLPAGEGKAGDRRKLTWHIFDPDQIEAAERVFGKGEAHSVKGMKRGGKRPVAGWGWVLDAFPPAEGAENVPWGFLSDGSQTVPVLLPAGKEIPSLSGPWVLRGERRGATSGFWQGLPMASRRGAGRDAVPEWWDDLPVVALLDVEPLAEAVAEVERRERVALRVRPGDRRVFRRLFDCLRVFRAKGPPGAAVSIRGDLGFLIRHRLRRLARGRFLAAEIALRWLREIPVVESIDVDETSEAESDDHALSAWQRRRLRQMSAAQPVPGVPAADTGSEETGRQPEESATSPEETGAEAEDGGQWGKEGRPDLDRS